MIVEKNRECQIAENRDMIMQTKFHLCSGAIQTCLKDYDTQIIVMSNVIANVKIQLDSYHVFHFWSLNVQFHILIHIKRQNV